MTIYISTFFLECIPIGKMHQSTHQHSDQVGQVMIKKKATCGETKVLRVSCDINLKAIAIFACTITQLDIKHSMNPELQWVSYCMYALKPLNLQYTVAKTSH